MSYCYMSTHPRFQKQEYFDIHLDTFTFFYKGLCQPAVESNLLLDDLLCVLAYVDLPELLDEVQVRAFQELARLRDAYGFLPARTCR